MFQASSAHLQEDTVVYMKHMVLSLCKQVSGRVLVKHDLCARYVTHTTGSKLRCQTPTKHTENISEPLQISDKYSSILPDDGSHTIRNMSE